MSVVNWGIIGLGKIANKFASGFDQLKNSRLYSVASKKKENLEEFQKKHQCELCRIAPMGHLQ